MEALRIILDEHQSLAAILHAMRHIIGEIGAGRLQPDFGLLRAMVYYLDAYPEQSHHPKEDRYLFAPLKLRTSEGAEALAQLAQEHADSEVRIHALEVALGLYSDDAPDGFATFSQAFESYAAFYRSHMLLEEREILPLLLEHLTAEDWAAAAQAFRAETDPMSGTQTAQRNEDFQRIFSKLVAAAPDPIGLGAGRYEDV